MLRSSLVGLVGLLVVACSSQSGGLDDSFYVGENQGAVKTPPSSSGGGPVIVSNATDAGPESCVANAVESKLTPIRLVFMFDKSGSMGNDSKWTSVTAALKDFFADPNDVGVSASLQYFPLDNNECSDGTYTVPEVAMAPLPDASSFASSMNAHQPGGGTPTLPAIHGALQYAVAQSLQHPDEKPLIVLVTDGDPNDCSSTVDAVSNAAAQGLVQGVPTYVIGVGSLLSNLDKIAQGGGTQKAILVPTNNPVQAKDEFAKALQTVRGKAMCELAIPDPGAGKTLDYNTINVAFTPGSGSKVTLTYDKDCGGSDGWHYDDPTKPTKIELCASACSAIQKASGGKVEVSLGCATKGGVH